LVNAMLDRNGVKTEILDNGLKVMFKEIHHAPLVSVWCWYKVGSKNERPGITGISHWVEHMNFKGSKNLRKEDFKNMIDRIGGMWNGYTWIDQTTYLGTLPSYGLETILKIESERMANCLYDPKEVESERTVIISELQGGENNPENLLEIEVNKKAFDVHPYQWPTIGYLEDLNKITRDDLYNYYRTYYVPNNSTLIVVGDFEHSNAVGLVKKYFGSIEPGETPSKVSEIEPPQKELKQVTIEKEGTTSYLQVSHHAPSISDPDLYPLLVVDSILAGAKGVNLWASDIGANVRKSSRLYSALIDRKLATKVKSFLMPTENPYLYSIVVTLRDKAFKDEAQEVLFKEFERIKNGDVTERELQKAINQFKLRFTLESEGVTSFAHQLGFFETIARYESYSTFLDNLKSVTLEDVSQMAEKYLKEEDSTVGLFLHK